MKRLWGITLLGIAAAIMAGAFSVYAQTSVERIDQFSTRIEVRKDATIGVTERITYNFGNGSRHGIFRNIPVNYKTSLGNQSAKISNVSVVDENGASYRFFISKKGDNEEIKIGDPDTLVSGIKTYIITYTVERALGYFENYDEIYWNTTGNGWDVMIVAADVAVRLPESVLGTSIQSSCYFGYLGGKDQCKKPDPGNGEVEQLNFSSPRPLNPHEGLTVAVGFPKGIVAEPTQTERLGNFITDNIILGLPVVVLVIMFGLWYRKGRDPKGRGTTVAHYDAPDNLTPVEISAVLHQGARNNDISAEIIYLATKGYLKITRLDEKGFIFSSTDYLLTKLKDQADLPAFDRKLMDSIFANSETKLSDLKNKFHKRLPGIKKSVVSSVVSKEYYPSDPQKIRAKYIGYGIWFFLLIGCSGFIGLINGALVISFTVSGIVIIAFGLIMPKATKKGAEAKEAILGLKEYLQIAEKDRINFHNAPEKKPELFEKLLPYAMVLGVEKAWAKEFESMHMSSPSWYNDPSGRAFNALILTNSLSSFRTSAASTLSSSPGGHSGSGGGGFSGGGGGGGGGGSW